MKLTIFLTILVLTATALRVKDAHSLGNKKMAKTPQLGFQGNHVGHKLVKKHPKLVKTTSQETAKNGLKTNLHKTDQNSKLLKKEGPRFLKKPSKSFVKSEFIKSEKSLIKSP